MIELAKLISDRKETTFVPTIGDKVRQRIKELIKTSVEREEKMKILDQLRYKKDELWKKWEYLNKEDEEKYTELESEYEYGKMVYLSYHFMTKQDMENLDLEITNFILESTYDRRDEFEKKSCRTIKI